MKDKIYTPEEFERLRERKIEREHEKIDDYIRDIQAQSNVLRNSMERQINEVTVRKMRDFIDEVTKCYAKIDALEVDDDEVLEDY